MPLDRSQSTGLFPINDKSAAFNRKVGRWVGPASYATGGESLASDNVGGLGKVRAVLGVISNGSAIRIGWYNPATNKLLWFVPNTGAEVINATDLSGYTGQLEIVGI